MTLAARCTLIAVAFGTLVHAQTGGDASKTLSEARTAMGGEKLAAVTSFTASGTLTKVENGQSEPADFDLAVELPDKFVKKEQLGSVMGLSVHLTSGFNGSALIFEVEQPQMAGISVRPMGAGSSGGKRTPEQQAADDARSLQRARDDFRRLTLGMFAASFAGAPLEFTAGGQADSPDGPLDVIVAKGGGFDGKLYINAKTHLPVAATWMDKEPLVGAPGSNTQTFTSQQSAEERAAAMAEADKRRQAAEAARKIVEWRMFYTNFKAIDGLTMPTTFTTSVGGKATSQLELNKIKINPKIDAKRFAPKK